MDLERCPTVVYGVRTYARKLKMGNGNQPRLLVAAFGALALTDRRTEKDDFVFYSCIALHRICMT